MPDIFTPKNVHQESHHTTKPHPQENTATVAEKETIEETPQQKADKPIESSELKEEAQESLEHPVDAMQDLPEHLRTPPQNLGLFSHYCPNPNGVSFVNQERNEKIILFLRRHFVTNVPWIALTLVLLLIPPITYLSFRLIDLRLFAVPLSLSIIMVSFYYLVILNYALMKFIEWFYHVGIVTKKRMLDLDIDNILTHHLSETNISDIVDVSYSQKGFFESFFNYGDVPIQTEAIKANFEFEATPHPSTVSDIVSDLRPQHPHAAKGANHHA